MVLKNETGGTVYIEGGTISSDHSQVVDNNGTMYITGGTLTIGNVAQGIINNNSGATLTMTGGTITSPTSNGRQAIYNLGTLNVSGNSVLNSNSTTRGTVQNDDNNAIFNFSGGIITSTNKNCQRGAFQNNKGNAYITGGTITSASTYLKNGVAEIGGIQNSGLVLEIGTQGDGIDTTSPVIQGKNYGIYSTKNYSFYDGIIKGMIDAVNDDSRITGYESDPFLRIPETIDNNIYYTLTYNTSGASATYHITLNAKGGTVTPKSIDIPAGDSVGTFLPTPTNGTSTFDGWYEDEQYNTLVTSSTIPTADTIYYAKWS